jgi:hypothetical protein
MMERIRSIGDWCRLDLKSKTTPTFNNRHDFIWTPFWACKHLMENLSSLFLDGSKFKFT